MPGLASAALWWVWVLTGGAPAFGSFLRAVDRPGLGTHGHATLRTRWFFAEKRRPPPARGLGHQHGPWVGGGSQWRRSGVAAVHDTGRCRPTTCGAVVLSAAAVLLAVLGRRLHPGAAPAKLPPAPWSTAASTGWRIPRKGLLDGSADYYTTDLDLATEQDPAAFWRAAQADAAGGDVGRYLRRIKRAMDDFLQSGELYGREPLLRRLEASLAQPGKFCVLLGGKNVGKTTMLRKLARDFADRMFIVDGRVHSDNIASGLVDALPKSVLVNFVRALGSFEIGRKDLLTLKFSTSLADSPLRFIYEFVEFHGKNPVIVVDECQLALASSVDTRRGEEARKLLELFTAITKQDRKASVLLCSSSGAETERLAALGFSLLNFTSVFYAGEVPPAQMYSLLTEQWVMGPRLAEEMVSYYGGHIFTVNLAVDELLLDQEQFNPGTVSATLDYAVLSCLLAGDARPDMHGMRALLTELARQGFLRVSADRPAVRMVIEQNLGGIVRFPGHGCGLPAGALAVSSETLVAASHYTRMKIKAVLAVFEQIQS